MKLKQLGLLGLCSLLLFGCTKANTNQETNDDNDVNEIESSEVVDETITDPEDEIMVPEQIEEVKQEEVKQETSEKKEEAKTDNSKEENKPATLDKPKDKVKEDDPIDIVDPLPTPTTPPPYPNTPDESKEDPKIEEEIKYGGWHESDKAQSVFNKINKVREENGLSTLPWNDGDTWLADVRSEELVSEVANGTVHSGLKKYDRYVGEIAGFGYSPSGVVDAWMNSSGHKNQILADYNTSMAVGVYYDEYTDSSYYIVIFR